MSIGGGVVLAVTFQKVDAAPHAQAAAQGDDQSLQNVDSVGKKAHIHIIYAAMVKKLKPFQTIKGRKNAMKSNPKLTALQV